MLCIRLRIWLLVGAAAVLGLPWTACAQAQSENETQRFDRELQQIYRDSNVVINPAESTDERAMFDYGGYLTVSYLSLQDLNSKSHSLAQYDLVGYSELNIDNVQDIFVRGRLEWQEFGDGQAFAGRDHQFHPEIERAYYRFDLGRAMSAYQGVTSDSDLVFKGGRQLIYWANGLALAQTLDGIRLDLSHQKTNLQILGGVTLANTIDIDASRPDFDSNTHRGFYGAMLTQDLGKQKPFVYYVSQQDYNHGYVSTIGTGADRIHTRFQYDSNYLGIGTNGSIGDHLTDGLELVYESGKTLSNSFDTALAPVPQTRDHIQAFAGDLRLDYAMSDPEKSRVNGDFIFATGDDARRQTTNTVGGAPPNTRDTAFNAFGQVQNGISFSPTISNLLIYRIGASTFPLQSNNLFKKLQTGLDLFVYQKCNRDAPLDEPSTNHGFVGIEPDIYLNWQIKSDVTLAMRYGVLFPGDALVNNNVRQFLYAGLTFAF